ncbi:SRPBCC domain-containing protein [Planctomicrobium sp. SH664]|uniref:SRPBCC domain-containing protein n=1 Tax=Planctomicrobium sp. SH664 TaxID=3448125 RepID=UPI003F5AEE1B
MLGSRFTSVIYIRTTPEQLWRGLIDPQYTRQYWAETWQDSTWVPGADWKLMIPDGRVGDSGTVLEFDAPRRLSVTWKNVFHAEFANEAATRLTCVLEPVGTSVKLTLVHESEDPHSKLIAAVSEAWPHLLSSLKSLLETGESLLETRKWPEGM